MSAEEPVNATPANTDRSAAGQSPRRSSWASRNTNAQTAPIPAPTSGKAQAASASNPAWFTGRGAGILVRKAVAAAKSANNPVELITVTVALATRQQKEMPW